MKYVLLISFVILTVLITGCNMNVDMYQKVHTNGNSDLRIEVTSDTPSLINMFKEQVYENLSSDIKIIEESPSKLILEASNIHNKYNLNIVDNGNWFKHEYVVTQDPVRDDTDDSSGMGQLFLTGNLYITVPGTIDSVNSGCIKKNSHTASCSLYKSVHVESSCYMFFC